MTRLASGFNEMVQWDNLFMERLMISHCIDETTRWSAGGVIDDREGSTLAEALTMHWIRPFGAKKLLVTDQEVSTCLSRNGIQLETKEPGSHAQIVERHYEILRQLVHRVQAQLR